MEKFIDDCDSQYSIVRFIDNRMVLEREYDNKLFETLVDRSASVFGMDIWSCTECDNDGNDIDFGETVNVTNDLEELL